MGDRNATSRFSVELFGWLHEHYFLGFRASVGSCAADARSTVALSGAEFKAIEGLSERARAVSMKKRNLQSDVRVLFAIRATRSARDVGGSVYSPDAFLFLPGRGLINGLYVKWPRKKTNKRKDEKTEG